MISNTFRDISVSKRCQDIGISLNAWHSVPKICKCDEQFCVVTVAGPNLCCEQFYVSVDYEILYRILRRGPFSASKVHVKKTYCIKFSSDHMFRFNNKHSVFFHTVYVGHLHISHDTRNNGNYSHTE